MTLHPGAPRDPRSAERSALPMPIHPTSIIDRHAEIDPSAEIGPYAIIDGPAVIGARTRVLAHAVVTGRTLIGADNVIHYGAVLGDTAQDLTSTGQESALRIGDRNVFRENCHIHRGSKPGGETVIGDDNYFMSQSHVAHDCQLSDHIIMASGSLLGGHVEVGDRVFVSGNCVVHQFVRIGRLAFLRGLSRASRDVPPFCMMDETHTLRGVNVVGLRRAGFGADQIRALRGAYRCLFRTRRNLRLAMAELESEPCTPEVAHLLAFIRSSRRGVCVGPRHGAQDDSQ